MRFSIDVGDFIVSPYKIEFNITPYKKYKVIRKINDTTIEFIDDSNIPCNHNTISFFEADTFFELSLYRIFKILINFETKLTH